MPAPDLVVVAGTVRDAATRARLGGVGIEILDGSGHVVASVTANRAGSYEVRGLPRGTYFARTTRSRDWVGVLYGAEGCASCPVDSGQPIAFEADSSSATVDFSLRRGGRIAGTVTDRMTGRPLAGVSVGVYDQEGRRLETAITDERGAYLLPSAVPDGRYHAKTENALGYMNEVHGAPGCAACAVVTGAPIELSAGAIASGIDFELDRGGRIAGTVRLGRDRSPLAGFPIEIYDSTGELVSRARSDEHGAYVSDAGLPEGAYYARTATGTAADRVYGTDCEGCHVLQGAPIAVAGTAITQDVDFIVYVNEGISGTVTRSADGAVLPFTSVFIYNSAGSFVTSGSTNVSGVYNIPLASAGTFYARTSSFGGYVDELFDNIVCEPDCTETNGTPIVVNAGATTTSTDFVLDTGGTIAGMVTDAGTGNPISSVTVQIVDATGASAGFAFTSMAGAFSLGGLPTGSFYAATSNSAGYIDEVFNNRPCFPVCSNLTMGDPIAVTIGMTTPNVDFALDEGGSLSGQVTKAADGAGLGSVSIEVYTSSGVFIDGAFTPASGDYQIGGLIGGDYFVATFNSLGYLDEAWNNVLCEPCDPWVAGAPVAVALAADTPDIDFALGLGATITGVLTNAANGAFLNGTTVTVWDIAGGFVGSDGTDANGVYSVGGLTSASYFVSTSASGGFVNEVFDNVQCPKTCVPTSGTPVPVTAPDTTADIDFALDLGGIVTGTLVNAVTMAPISGGLVQLYDASNQFLKSAASNASGVYTINGLVGGTFFARTSVNAYINELYDGIPCFPSCATLVLGTGIPVTLGSTTSGIDFALDPGGAIAGTATDGAARDAASAPISGVTIRAFDLNGTQVGAVNTSASGTFSIGGLLAGRYFVRADAATVGYVGKLFDDIPCVNCSVFAGMQVVVNTNATTTGIDFALDAAAEITGTVTNAQTSAPLQSVTVQAYLTNGSFASSALTNAMGIYTIRGLPPDTYFAVTSTTQNVVNELYDDIPCPGCSGVLVTTGTPIQGAARAAATGIDFALEPGATITGTVTDEITGLPLQGSSVSIVDETNRQMGSATTNAAGVYVVGGLRGGSYYARATGPFNTFNLDEVYNGLPCTSCNALLGAPIAVPAGGAITGIDFSLGRGGRVSGMGTNATTGSPIQVSVTIRDAQDGSRGFAFAAASGVYTSGAVPPGTYYAVANANGFATELYDNHPCAQNCTARFGTAFAVTANATTGGIDFALDPLPAAQGGTGSIRGTLTHEATGLPLNGVTVQAFNSAGVQVGSATTNAQGAYLIQGLVSGIYYARTTNSQNLINEAYNNIACGLGCTVTAGQPIVVTAPGTTTGIDFTLADGGRIAGTVRDAVTMSPIANVTVSIFSATGALVTSIVTNHAGGYASWAGLPSAAYYARTTNALGYTDDLYDDILCVGCTVTTGTPIAVVAGTTTAGIDFGLDAGGVITGVLTDAATGAPLFMSGVAIHNAAGATVASPSTNGEGRYLARGLATGQFFARTTTSGPWVNQLHNGITCVVCTATTGTPIGVVAGAISNGISFALLRGGRIAGTIADALSAQKIFATAAVFDGAGVLQTSTATDGFGNYITNLGLPPAQYFVRATASGYNGEIFDDMPCPPGCNVTAGTPVSVTAGTVTPDIDFGLGGASAIRGRVTSGVMGLGENPLGGIEVRFYNSSNVFVGSVSTDSGGNYQMFPGSPGIHYARTRNTSGYTDELYGGNACPACEATAGTPILVQGSGSVDNVDFSLSMRPDPIFTGDFDSGTFAGWGGPNQLGGGDLSVTPAAALGGTAFGLQALVNDTGSLYVQDNSPDDESYYRARFQFDPNDFDPGVANGKLRTRILLAFGGGDGVPTRRLMAVVLRLLNGNYAIMTRVSRNNGTRANTGFFPIGNGPHTIEIAWRRATSPDLADGTFQMWIDGVLVSTLTGLQTNANGITFVRLGGLSLKAGANGTLYWDNFVSRRLTFIGQ
jgi:hypothetical protein